MRTNKQLIELVLRIIEESTIEEVYYEKIYLRQQYGFTHKELQGSRQTCASGICSTTRERIGIKKLIKVFYFETYGRVVPFGYYFDIYDKEKIKSERIEFLRNLVKCLDSLDF